MNRTTPPKGSWIFALVYSPLLAFPALGAIPDQPYEMKPKTGLPAFEYMESPYPMPNYLPGQKWGTTGEPIRTMQKPLSPEESARHLVTLPGFEARLFAAEPDIVKPIYLAWDVRGRLWIAETVDYPNSRQKPGEGHDRIKICEDTDGDGRADKFTVFADRLSIPTSFVFANGGIVVSQVPDILFLKDTDGDDQADIRLMLFTGWGTYDTHAGPSNLRYGFDNWIWGVVGYAGFDGQAGDRSHRFQMGFFCFKPNGSALEFIRSSNNNTWGLGLSEDNIIFGSTANNNASMYMPIANRYYEAVNGWSASRVESIADDQRLYPITDKIRQVDWHGRYTAGAGHALYTARSYPKEYWNRAAFVAGPTGHLLGKFALERQGADFISHNLKNFLASDDEWCAPILAEVGPDGQLWVIDWYNYIIQHNPTPSGFKTGSGNAYETPLRDKIHGRIYRIVYKEAKPAAPIRLDRATPKQWVATLKNDNLLWRLHAQRLLVERAQTDVVPDLLALVRNRSVDEIGLNPAAIHALWTLDGLGAIYNGDAQLLAEVIGALKHPSAGVRRATLMVMPLTEDTLRSVLASGVLQDEDAHVRMSALLTLSEMPISADAGRAVAAMMRESRNADDAWIPDAATCAAARHDAAFLASILSETKPDATVAPSVGKVLRIVSHHFASQAPMDKIVPTLLSLKAAASPVTQPILEGLAGGWPDGESPKLSDQDRAALQDLINTVPVAERSRLVALAERWGQRDIFAAQIASIAAALQARVQDENLPAAQRIGAARQWVEIDDQLPTLRAVLEDVTLTTPPPLAMGLINALAQSKQTNAAQVLIDRWTHYTPAARRTVISSLLRKEDWAESLLNNVQSGTLIRTDIPAEYWQQLQSNPSASVAAKAKAIQGAQAAPSSAEMAALAEKLLPIADQKGDKARGKEVYETLCMTCHSFAGRGGQIGPDLVGVGARPRREILLDIIDPNRSVEANFRLWTVTTKDGETYSGRLETETLTTVEILDLTGMKHTVQRSDIETLEASRLSIMPIGFETMPPHDMSSLLDYLTDTAHE